MGVFLACIELGEFFAGDLEKIGVEPSVYRIRLLNRNPLKSRKHHQHHQPLLMRFLKTLNPL